MSSTAAVARGDSAPWIRDKRFDLFFLTLSGALVFFPYLSYGLLQRLGVSEATSSLIVGLSVTVLVGGPHMYSTYLRTAFEPRFRRRHPVLTFLPLIMLPTPVILGALYTMAMYKFVSDKFALGSSVLLFPDFLKHRWVAIAFTVGYAAFFLFYVARTLGEIRRGETSWPRLLFMTMTVAMAFVVPIFDNLDVSFQGFNTWHSLQYLAL